MQKNKLITQNRLKSIDALRGLAAITIIIYHARSMFWIGLGKTWEEYGLSLNLNAWLGYASFPFSFGSLAVGLFFVLSGYCIHRRGAYNLATNPQSSFKLKQYAFRRFWRIYPTYFAALGVTALVDIYVRASSENLIPETQDNSWFAFLMSLFSLQGLVAPTFGHNTSLWTLALELHFYAIYPLLYYLSRKQGPTKAVGLTLIASSIYLILEQILHLSNFFPYKGSGGPIFIPYWFTWGFGFYIAEIEAGRVSFNQKYWRILAIISAILTIPISLFFDSATAMFTSTFAFGYLLYWSMTEAGTNFWNSSYLRLFSAIGMFSYSIYVIHRPVLLISKVNLFNQQQSYVNLFPVFSVILLSIMVGWSFFQLVERWTLKNINLKKIWHNARVN